jgi:hypothetical protein
VSVHEAEPRLEADAGAVLAALRAHGRMTAEAVAAAAALDVPSADRALQALLLRRAVLVSGPPGPRRGSRTVGFRGASRVATWAAADDAGTR